MSAISREPDDERAVPFPCGVADAAAGVAYVSVDGGIVAVDLETGQELWRTALAWRPLAIVEDRLAAACLLDGRPSAIRIALLDPTREGQPTLVSDPVTFPEWVSVATDRPESFRLTAEVEGSRLLLRWEAHRHYGGGAAPSLRVQREATRRAAGVIAVDLQSGDATPVADLAADPPPPPHAQDLTQRWCAGARLARLAWNVDDGEQSLSLETTDPSGGDARVVELARGRGLVAQVTPSGGHLFVHEERGSSSANGMWWVFSAQTGQRVATLTHERGARSPVIVGRRAYYVVEALPDGSTGEGAALPRTLKARELETDAPVWELPLGARRASAAPRMRQGTI